MLVETVDALAAGSIGSALPFAAAAKLAFSEAPVVTLMGDGTLGFHLSSLRDEGKLHVADMMRPLDDRTHVLKTAAAEEHERNRHKYGVLVYGLHQPVDRRTNGILGRHVLDLGAISREAFEEIVVRREIEVLHHGSWEQKVIEEIAPRPQDYVIPKYRWSTFHQTYFDLALRSRGIDTIIISGGAVDVGVASTVYSARDHDYNVIVVRDACSNSHEDSMAAFMNTIFPRMARVRTTDQILKMIQQGINRQKNY